MSETKTVALFISCPKGIERLLTKELAQLGLGGLKETVGGVYAEALWHDVYTVCLHSRLANRVFLVLNQHTVNSEKDLYQAASAVPWSSFFSENKSFVVDFTGTNKAIRHSQFGALRVKDAIVDYFYELMDTRPTVDIQQPDVRVYAHLRRQRLMLGIELSGGSLHQRGYRSDGAKAPLKENLAAALVMDAMQGQEKIAYFTDPMCGAGTLLIEAVLRYLDLPAAILRPEFGFEQLNVHQPSAWQTILQEARNHYQEQLAASKERGIIAYGYDQDGRVIEAAKANAERAGIAHLIEFKQQALQDFTWAQEQPPPLLLCNPPYGERLEERNSLFMVYQLLGEKIRQHCQASSAWVLSSDDYLLKALALQKGKAYQFYNGSLAVQWTQFEIYQREQQEAVRDERFEQGVSMVENRLRKNQKHLNSWLKKNAISCYRIYDADIPEYAFAVDCYDGQYHIAEYAPPKSVDEFAAFQRRQQFLQAVKNVWQLSDRQLFLKERKQQKGKQQYEKVAEQKHFFTVQEGQAQILVNLSDYLDTGLFLDHRPARLMLAEQAKDKRFLNLFCYTAVATVHAALGGAASSLSVDMSQTYLNWAERNFRKNRLNVYKHQTLHADVLQWLDKQKQAAQYDVIFLDPPSFSNSKRMTSVLDIQRDHVKLIQQTMFLLAQDGVLIFSNNRRDFKMDESLKEQFEVVNITHKTIDKDFQRNQKIHNSWEIRHR